jgi:hypothetical protein
MDGLAVGSRCAGDDSRVRVQRFVVVRRRTHGAPPEYYTAPGAWSRDRHAAYPLTGHDAAVVCETVAGTCGGYAVLTFVSAQWAPPTRRRSRRPERVP